MFDFEIKIAKTPAEKNGALRLRFDVFKREMNPASRMPITKKKETDLYDRFCDHLIVVDKTKNLVVGTYRLLLNSRVNPKIGFYSEKMFDITRIKTLGNNILELSRSCVHKDYREGIVINLLWNGIAKYIKDNHVKYLFGSVRLNTTEPKQVNNFFNFVKNKYYSSDEFRVYPLKKYTFKELDEEDPVDDYKKIFFGLPPLVKGYLRLGVKFCGPPAWNPDFGSVVFFILLDIKNASDTYRRHFLGA
jgi:putative hemolysin